MKHGCHNTPRQPGYWADNSGADDRLGVNHRIYVQDTMTPDCQYAKGVPDDPRCIDNGIVCNKKGKQNGN